MQTGLVEEGQPLQLSVSLRIIKPAGGSTPGDSAAAGAGGAASQLNAVITDPAGATILQQRSLPSHANLTTPATGFGRYSLW